MAKGDPRDRHATFDTFDPSERETRLEQQVDNFENVGILTNIKIFDIEPLQNLQQQATASSWLASLLR